MTGPRVLIVEDDLELRATLVRGLEEEGFRTSAVGGGSELLSQLAVQEVDALVVDIGLPDADGRDLCQALRAQGLDVPVLFLTARDTLADRLAGFSAGGDDYLTKPFAFAELVARLQALLRRTSSTGAIEVGGLRLDPLTHAACVGAMSVMLTPTEFRLLARLLSRPGETVRRRQLVQAAWPHGAIVHDNTLDAYIARLRRKLRDLPQGPRITTVHGVGYSIR